MSSQLSNGLADHPMAMDVESQIRDLRAIQHFMLTHPDLPISYVSGRTAQISVPHLTDGDGVIDWDSVDTAKVADIVRMMKDGGKVEKRSSDLYMTYTRRLGKAARLELSVERKAVCTARVVGEREVITPAQAESRTVEKIIEWDCAPILAQAEEDIAS